MMAHNLCYTTLVSPDKVKELPAEATEKTPTGDFFVKSSVQKASHRSPDPLLVLFSLLLLLP